MRLNIQKIIELSNTSTEILISSNYSSQIRIVAEDVTPNDVFIAIDSSKYDIANGALGFSNNEDSVFGLGGTLDIREKVNLAIQNGAALVFVDNEDFARDIDFQRYILIEDSLSFIKNIAKYIISLCDVKTIAITGSTGKTTTTFAISDILSKKYKVMRIHRIRNTVIGTAIDIIENMTSDTDFLVLELQIDGKGQLDSFFSFIVPDYSIVTCINLSHYARFNNIDDVINEKMKAFTFLKDTGICLINGDDPYLQKWYMLHGDKRVKTVGFSANCIFRFSDVNVNPETGFYIMTFKNRKLTTQIKSMSVLYAACYAISLSSLLGLSDNEIEYGLQSITNPVGRLNGFLGKNGCLVIVDSYNSNSLSMINGLKYTNGLCEYKTKIVILGSLLEAGKYTEAEHRKVGKFISQFCHFDRIITLGEGASYILREIKKANQQLSVEAVYDYEDVISLLKGVKIDSKTVFYIKGSGAMRMELIAPFLLGERLF